MSGSNRYGSLMIIITGIIVLVQLCVALAWAEKQKLTVASGWGDNFYNETEKKIARRFEETHPDVKVEVLVLPEYFDKLMGLAAAGDLPDVFPIWHRARSKYIAMGIIGDLSSYAARDNYDIEDLMPPIQEAIQVDGKLWGIPWNWSAWTVQFNRDAFEEAGMIQPDQLLEHGDWSFHTLAESAAKLTRRDADNELEQIGIYTARDHETIFGWIWGMGGSAFNEDGTKCVINQEAAVRGLNFAHDLVFERDAMSVGVNPGTLPWSGFTNGDWGMNIWWHNVINYYKIGWGLPMEFGQVPFPAGPVDPVTNVCSINTWAISSQTEIPNLAWEYIKFQGSAEIDAFKIEEMAEAPTHLSNIGLFADVMEQKYRVSGAELFYASLGAQARPYRMPVIDEGLFELTRVLEPMWRGEESVTTVVKKAADAVNVILAQER